MNWPEDLYELFGASHPIASLIIASLLGTIIFGGGWWIIGQKFKKHHLESSPSLMGTPTQGTSKSNDKKADDKRAAIDASERETHREQPKPRTKEPPLPVVQLRHTVEPTNSIAADAPYAVKIVIQTNVPIQPSSLNDASTTE